MLHHVALLVPDLTKALAGVRALGLEPGEVGTFPAEGTREAYCGPDEAPARLLLIEAAGPGPYARTLARRGPGLHHVAVVAADAAALAGSTGWLPHPRAPGWLTRPGAGTLVEVMSGPDPAGQPVVEAVEVPLSGAPASLLSIAPGLVASADGVAWLRLGGRRVAARGGLEALA